MWAVRRAPSGSPRDFRSVSLCGKVGGDGMPPRDQISQQILLQKLEAAGRRYMRDLRRQATIDVKQP